MKTADNQTGEFKKNSDFIELQKFAAQRFAIGEAKERLEGAYISFDKLPENVQDAIVKGEEYLLRSAYIKDGKMNETCKMVQMVYSPTSGSRLDVQIKRKEPVTLDKAKSYNHQFTKVEFDKMVNEGKHIVFLGNTSDGEMFPKLAYYEPKLNDIRTKPALTANTYVYGQQLTQEQADAMNKGMETKITFQKTKKGPITYMVKYSPRAERFFSKSLENSKVNDMEVKKATTVAAEKKKQQPNNAISL